MSSNEVAGSFLALRGENCNFTSIGGVKSLRTDAGVDLVSLGNRIDSLLSGIETKLKNIEQRITSLETRPAPVSTGKGKVSKLEDIADVDTTGLVDGGILTWVATTKKWVATATD
jgi:hypothetical protein